MSFDYFNVSHLAFGSKLTKAFSQLDRLCTEAEDNLVYLYQILDIFGEFIDRNYPCPFPTRGDAPVRAKELFDLLNDANALRKIYLDANEDLNVEVIMYKRQSNRFTVGTGKTSLKKGYVFCKDSVSNKNYERDLQFVENYDDGVGHFLFEFRIDGDKHINIVGESKKYFSPSRDFDHISSMEKVTSVLVDTNLTNGWSYTAEDYETIICVGYAFWGTRPYHDDGARAAGAKYGSILLVRINDEDVVEVGGADSRQFVVVYLKPGDKLSGNIKNAIKIKYTSDEPIPDPPTEPPTEPPVPAVEIEKQRKTYATYSYSGNQWRFSDNWQYREDDTETDFTGSLSKTEVLYAIGCATGGLFTFNRPTALNEVYKLSFTFNGSTLGPFYSEEVEDQCRIYFLDQDNQLISTQNLSVVKPGEGETGRTVTTATDITVPGGTQKIRIASMGFSYNSLQQRYYSEVAISNVLLTEGEE